MNGCAATPLQDSECRLQPEKKQRHDDLCAAHTLEPCPRELMNSPDAQSYFVLILTHRPRLVLS